MAAVLRLVCMVLVSAFAVFGCDERPSDPAPSAAADVDDPSPNLEAERPEPEPEPPAPTPLPEPFIGIWVTPVETRHYRLDLEEVDGAPQATLSAGYGPRDVACRASPEIAGTTLRLTCPGRGSGRPTDLTLQLVDGWLRGRFTCAYGELDPAALRRWDWIDREYEGRESSFIVMGEGHFFAELAAIKAEEIRTVVDELELRADVVLSGRPAQIFQGLSAEHCTGNDEVGATCSDGVREQMREEARQIIASWIDVDREDAESAAPE